MLFDYENMFHRNAAITVSAVLANVINLGPNSWAGNSSGQRIPTPISGAIRETFTADGAATLKLEVRSSASSDLSSPRYHAATADVAKASLVAGARFDDLFPGLQIPEDALQYVGIYATVATGPFTAGKMDIGVVVDKQTNR